MMWRIILLSLFLVPLVACSSPQIAEAPKISSTEIIPDALLQDVANPREKAPKTNADLVASQMAWKSTALKRSTILTNARTWRRGAQERINKAEAARK